MSEIRSLNDMFKDDNFKNSIKKILDENEGNTKDLLYEIGSTKFRLSDLRQAYDHYEGFKISEAESELTLVKTPKAEESEAEMVTVLVDNTTELSEEAKDLGFNRRLLDKMYRISKTIDMDKLSKGKALDISELSDEQIKTLLTVAAHCMCNGPVGVNNKTTFPLIKGKISIVSIVPCSNKSWKEFCHFLYKEGVITVKDDCQTVKLYGDPWPICEEKMEKIKEAKAKKV